MFNDSLVIIKELYPLVSAALDKNQKKFINNISNRMAKVIEEAIKNVLANYHSIYSFIICNLLLTYSVILSKFILICLYISIFSNSSGYLLNNPPTAISYSVLLQ